MIIIKSGGLLSFHQQVDSYNELEVGVYSLFIDEKGNCFLAEERDLETPKKTYDFEKSFRDQVLKTLAHKSANNNIGVLFTGTKGFGKSVQAKMLSLEANLPVILIKNKIHKSIDFTSFLNTIEQDHVLFIDEFEKLFPKNSGTDKDQDFHNEEVFLSLLDGTMNSKYKRLVILTTNSEVGDKFLSRPSRIRYYKEFYHMSEEVYDAVIEDKLKNKDFEDDLRENLPVDNCSIDILSTIIEEINIQNIPYSEFKEFFNHRDKKISYHWIEQKEDGTWNYLDGVELISNHTLKPIQDEVVNLLRSNGIYPNRLQLLRSTKDEMFLENTEKVIDKEKSTEKDEDGDTIYVYKNVKKNYKLKKYGDVFKSTTVVGTSGELGKK